MKKYDNKNKQLILSILGIVVLLIGLAGISYAMYTFVGTGTKENVITSGHITINYEEKNLISLNNTYPMTDNKGINDTEDSAKMQFDITSDIKGNTNINYAIAIDSLEEGNTLTADYVKIYLTKNNERSNVFADNTGRTLKSFEKNTIPNKIDNYVILTDTLTGTQKDSYEIKAWVADNYVLPKKDTSSDNIHSNTTTSETLKFKIKVIAVDNPLIINTDIDSPRLDVLDVTTLSGTYKAGDIINIKGTISEDVIGTEIPSLRIKIGITEKDIIGVKDGNIINYNYPIENGLNGSLTFITLIGGNLKDKVGNDFVMTLPEATGGNITVDTINPYFKTMSISNLVGYYKLSSVLTIVGTLNEEVTGDVPLLNIKIGTTTKQVTGIKNGLDITYNYTVVTGDNGSLSIDSISGGNLIDSGKNLLATNLPKINSKAIIIDTINPTCSISIQETSSTLKTLKINGTDTNLTSYSWDNVTYNSTNTKQVTANGTYKAYTKDAAGNIGSCSTIVSTVKSNINTLCSPGSALSTCMYNNRNNINNLASLGGAQRFVGTSTNVTNNYVCFGTSTKSTCTSNPTKYMYRIIGVYQNGSNYYTKLIKMSSLNNAFYRWYSSKTANMLWTGSTLKSILNGSTYLTNTTYVPSGWNTKIATWNWKYGTASGFFDHTADEIYSLENSLTSTTSAKVGLIYVHDFLYTMGDGSKNAHDDFSSSWMRIQYNDPSATQSYTDWTMSYGGNLWTGEYDAWIIGSSGDLMYESINGENNSFIRTRPVFYLENSVTYNSGSGTIADPIILN